MSSKLNKLILESLSNNETIIHNGTSYRYNVDMYKHDFNSDNHIKGSYLINLFEKFNDEVVKDFIHIPSTFKTQTGSIQFTVKNDENLDSNLYKLYEFLINSNRIFTNTLIRQMFKKDDDFYFCKLESDFGRTIIFDFDNIPFLDNLKK